MFLVFKLNKYRMIMAIVIIFVLIAMLWLGNYIISNRKTEHDKNVPATFVDEAENEKAASFIRSFGWKIEPKPVETEEFLIPKELSLVYRKYNELQKDIGTDLNNYRGERVRRYTYKVLNYKNPPQYQGQQVYADVIMHNGKPIAGDLKTNELNGFITSLKGRTFKEVTGIEEWEYR